MLHTCYVILSLHVKLRARASFHFTCFREAVRINAFRRSSSRSLWLCDCLSSKAGELRSTFTCERTLTPSQNPPFNPAILIKPTSTVNHATTSLYSVYTKRSRTDISCRLYATLVRGLRHSLGHLKRRQLCNSGRMHFAGNNCMFP